MSDPRIETIKHMARMMGYKLVTIQHGKLVLKNYLDNKTKHWNPSISVEDAHEVAAYYWLDVSFSYKTVTISHQGIEIHRERYTETQTRAEVFCNAICVAYQNLLDKEVIK